MTPQDVSDRRTMDDKGDGFLENIVYSHVVPRSVYHPRVIYIKLIYFFTYFFPQKKRMSSVNLKKNMVSRIEFTYQSRMEETVTS